MNTFSNHFFKMTIASGLLFGTLGAYSSIQWVSVSPQHSHAKSHLVMPSFVESALSGSSNWANAPASVKFNPIPNPEPFETGGTGTR